MEITKSEAIANHRKMWRWIAEETLKQERKVEKWEYFKEHGIRRLNIPLCQCYCCEYGFDAGVCPDCPVEWGGEYDTCLDRDNCYDHKGLYALWEREPNYLKAAELAKKIAELPEPK